MRIITGILLSLFATLALAQSPSGTALIAPTTASITDSAGNVWTISSAAGTTTGQVFINGKADTHAVKVSELAYINGVMWTMGSVGATYTSTNHWFFKKNANPADLWNVNNINPLLTVCGVPVLPPPPPPTANLTWSAVTTYVLGGTIPSTVPVTYNIYQGTSPTNRVMMATTPATSAVMTSGLSGGHTYYWDVTAVAGGVESPPSNVGSKSF
jgi:hypothetical protein